MTRLRDVTSGATTLPVAVGRFEAGMRTRGSAVLTQAMRTVRWILATDTARRRGTAVSTPILAAAARLRR
ncbi:hypothetical protein AB0H58_00430 [Nocardia neocaledoniensis]|uniref:hypothetical protein n=1 Tax=Nocardia neocaledoniensis TaxID=236511 RepID=UPI0033CA8F3B